MKQFFERATIIVIACLVSTSLLTSYAHAEASFKDVPVSHWAHGVIAAAVKTGYVTGYPDGTFKPANDVTVAEFTKMAMQSTDTKLGTDSSKWYLPAIDGARAAGFITKNDYADGNYNKKMTRMEMAKMAVLAVGQTANSNNEFVLKAVQLGLISGTGKGKLDINAYTNRAQSVAITQRILVIRGGGTLPVDQEALAAAIDLVGARKDAWGQPIRSTNLPSNYADYHYILRDLPNEFYTLKYAGQNRSDFTPAIRTFNESNLTKETLGGLKGNVENWFKEMFNLDYRTIDDNWVTRVTSTTSSSSTTKARLKEYVKWVKDNKIITKGTVNAEVSSIVGYHGYYYMKVYYTYEIVSANSSALKPGDNYYTTLFNNSVRSHYGNEGLKTGVTYKVVSEISIAPLSGHTWHQLDKLTINTGGTSLSDNFVVVK